MTGLCAAETVTSVRWWPGRARFVVNGLRGNRQLAIYLQKQISRGQGVEVIADALTGRVLIVQKGVVAAEQWATEARGQILSALASFHAPLAGVTSWREERSARQIETGLSAIEAERRLVVIGANTLPDVRASEWKAVLSQQLQDAMTLLLLFAAAGSLVLKRKIDAFAIVSVLALSFAVAVWQERQIRREDQSLKGLEANVAHVVRGGIKQLVPAAKLVPGDVVWLEAGDAVPADGVVVKANRLQVDESTLTGESVPVYKSAGVPPDDALYMGTSVTGGSAKMLIQATGSRTLLGKMASDLGAFKMELTPLQVRLQQLTKRFSTALAIWTGLTSAIALLRGESLTNALLTNLTMYVSAVPEGLPLLLMVAQVHTARKVHASALRVRRLQSLEALASITVLCADKTGTLTRNELTVTRVWHSNPDTYDGEPTLCECAALCNNADLSLAQRRGDPLEVALLEYAARQGLDLQRLARHFKRIWEEPFDAYLRRMSVICQDEADNRWLIVKGAPEVVLTYCTADSSVTRSATLRELEREAANHAYKVIAFAVKKLHHGEGDFAPRTSPPHRGMGYVGSVGLIDPPRKEAVEGLRALRDKGIKIAMLTGDHPATATAVGRSIRLRDDADTRVLTGEDLNRVTPETLLQSIRGVSIFARLSPQQKVNVIEALKADGEVVAMAGDGVNDALALRHAHVGIAMGNNGSDVAKRSSSLWLLGDDLRNFVKGVEVGKRMLASVERSVGYLIAGNISEVFLMSASVWFGWPSVFSPTQILLINTLTDSVPTFVLLTKNRSEMPLDRKGRLFGRVFWRHVLIRSAVMGVSALSLYRLGLGVYRNSHSARSLALYSVVANQMLQLQSWQTSSGKASLVPKGRWLGGTASGTLLALALALYAPGVRQLLGTAALPVSGVALGALGAVISGWASNTLLAK